MAARTQPGSTPLETTYLFRGHADAAWPLLPSLNRVLGTAIEVQEALEVEAQLLRLFQSQAHLVMAGQPLPADNDLLNWWMVMQHYGAPTRLLDWSASPYVAAYFACESLSDVSGTIWFIHPRSWLNSASDDLMSGKPNADLLRSSNAPHMVLPLPAFTQSTRTVAQQGYFTVCLNLCGKHDELLLDSCDHPLLDDSDIMGRFVIPAALKSEFLLQLRLMNVTASSLFPGLDGLGRSMSEAARLHAAVIRQTPDKPRRAWR